MTYSKVTPKQNTARVIPQLDHWDISWLEPGSSQISLKMEQILLLGVPWSIQDWQHHALNSKGKTVAPHIKFFE